MGPTSRAAHQIGDATGTSDESTRLSALVRLRAFVSPAEATALNANSSKLANTARKIKDLDNSTCCLSGNRARGSPRTARPCSCRCIPSTHSPGGNIRKQRRGFSSFGQHRQPIATRNRCFSATPQSFSVLKNAPERALSILIVVSVDFLQTEHRIGRKRCPNHKVHACRQG